MGIAQKAIAAVARKLAVILWRLYVERRSYRPAHNIKGSRRGLPFATSVAVIKIASFSSRIGLVLGV